MGTTPRVLMLTLASVAGCIDTTSRGFYYRRHSKNSAACRVAERASIYKQAPRQILRRGQIRHGTQHRREGLPAPFTL